MSGIDIRRPGREDSEELEAFFRTVIEDTFAKEGIGHLTDDIEQEIATKLTYLEADFATGGTDRYFLAAVDLGRVVGTIECGPASPLILDGSGQALRGFTEIGTVFVSPGRQGQGIGTLLLEAMYLALEKKGIDRFCLDSGYSRSQEIWRRKFGQPDYVLKDYWGEGADHLIWSRKLGGRDDP